MKLKTISYFNDVLRIIFYTITGYFALRFFSNGSVQILTTFFTRSVSFDIDTLFLHWNTTYPAITVCEVYNQEQWRRILNAKFQNDSELPPEDILIDIIYFRGFCTNCWQCGIDDTCNNNNLTILSNALRLSCEDLLFNCVYQSHFFSCCEHFKPIYTEYGTCYALNSNQARKSIEEQYTINRASGSAKLLFDVANDVEIFIHGNNEVPYFLAENIITEQVKQGLTKEILLQIMEVHNDADIMELPIEKRRCRFEKELVLWPQQQNFYTFYSYSSCIVECSVLLHLELCNCTQHFLAQAAHSVDNLNVSICDYNGLQCLSDNHDVFRQRTISCNCLSSCKETDFDIVFSSADNDKEYSFDEARVAISILDLPTERYVRHATQDYLNLLISFGGLLGLFFNVSFLRSVEILIKLFISCCVFIKKLKQKFYKV